MNKETQRLLLQMKTQIDDKIYGSESSVQSNDSRNGSKERAHLDIENVAEIMKKPA